jgi:hypothetical protein
MSYSLDREFRFVDDKGERAAPFEALIEEAQVCGYQAELDIE